MLKITRNKRIKLPIEGILPISAERDAGFPARATTGKTANSSAGIGITPLRRSMTMARSSTQGFLQTERVEIDFHRGVVAQFREAEAGVFLPLDGAELVEVAASVRP